MWRSSGKMKKKTPYKKIKNFQKKSKHKIWRFLNVHTVFGNWNLEISDDIFLQRFLFEFLRKIYLKICPKFRDSKHANKKKKTHNFCGSKIGWTNIYYLSHMHDEVLFLFFPKIDTKSHCFCITNYEFMKFWTFWKIDYSESSEHFSHKNHFLKNDYGSNINERTGCSNQHFWIRSYLKISGSSEHPS